MCYNITTTTLLLTNEYSSMVKKLTKAQRLAEAKKDLEKALKRHGYYKIKSKYSDSFKNDFPNLSTESSNKLIPSEGGFSKTTGKKQFPADAKQFPIGHNHKQGYQLITESDDLQFMGGKKT